MSISVTLSFTDLIIASTIFFSCLFFVMILSIAHNSKSASINLVSRNFPPVSEISRYLNVSLLLSTSTLVVFSIFPRGTIWFIIRTISVSLLAVYSFYKPKSQVVPLYLAINVGLASLTPILSLGFSAGETDQLPHVQAVNIIQSAGHIFPSQEKSLTIDPYYNLFPVLDFLVADFSSVTGLNAFESFAVLQVILPLVITLAIVIACYLLTGDHLTGVLAILILLGTDRLAFWTLIPQNLALELAIIAFLLLILFIFNPSTPLALMTLIFILFSNFTHASFGGLFLLSLLLLAFAFSWRRIPMREKLTSLCAASAVGLVSYWAIWNITSSVNIRAEFILENLLNAFSGRTVLHLAAKNSLLAISTPYSFLSWAIPPSLAFSFVAYKILINRLKFLTKFEIFILSISSVALLILAIGLYSTYGAGSLGVERYTDVPAFLALMISGSVVGAALVRLGKKPVPSIVLGLVVLSLILGSTQLNWAPDQYQSSYSYTNYEALQYSHSLSNMLPESVEIYYANVLGYTSYWNNSKTLLYDKGLQSKVDINRSISSHLLLAYATSAHTDIYFASGTDLIGGYNNLISSSKVDIVISDGEYETFLLNNR